MLSVEEQVSLQVSLWEAFYKEVFGWDLDFSDLKIPEKKEGFDRMLIVAGGLTTPEVLFQKCKELFPCWKWTDDNLDKVVISDRSSNKDGPYALWLRDRIEADEENKNLSANNLKKKGVASITLEERLLLELKYFKETNEHLDLKSFTLCAGSRYSDGDVPRVHWDDADELRVHWCSPDIAGGSLRSRAAVSRQKEVPFKRNFFLQFLVILNILSSH